MNTWPPSGTPRFNEIPAFVRFSPWDFDVDITVRSRPIYRFWNTDASIMLPLPSVIGTNTSMKYSSDLGAVALAQLDIHGLASTESGYVKDTGGIRAPRGYIVDPNGRKKLEPHRLGASTDTTPRRADQNYLDMVDTTWMGMNRRKYRFNFLLICKSIYESEIATYISNSFNLYSLSAMDTASLGGEIPSSMSRSLHPPMWAISVVGIGTPEDMTRDWLGMYPQLSVLSDIKTFRIGGEDPNSIQGMHDDGTSFLPLQFKIELEFTEIETVYQSLENRQTTARSQFWKE